MNTFKVGDVVELNSGSPKMTITKDNGDGTVEVSWSAPPLEYINTQTYPVVALKASAAS
jgi:hypothetical protein